MRYSVDFTSSAAREFKALDPQFRRRIGEKITALCDEPFPSGSKKLKGQADHFRIRVGDFRVVYRIDGKRMVVVIVRIGHRKEVYR
ncbi:MAG TPA: type II toxin-antitoxin system RelE/ParE family toxin [Candidatus Sulfotelmatobacter sp.]|nr:type II toxin-antitoxin system RelE/ParE family toxin [Candidatus Sulfotelmatobacter sp.]